MVYQLGFPARTATVVCVLLGGVLSLGMAFRCGVRCVVLLMLPGLCSSKGRSLLLAYAFLLVMTHPVPNFK